MKLFLYALVIGLFCWSASLTSELIEVRKQAAEEAIADLEFKIALVEALKPQDRDALSQLYKAKNSLASARDVAEKQNDPARAARIARRGTREALTAHNITSGLWKAGI